MKPLYYALLPDGKFIFGSELKSLLAHGGLARDLDPHAVEEYFALGYVPEPRTIYRRRDEAAARAHADDPARRAVPAAARILGRPLHARQPDQRSRRRATNSSQRLRESVRLRMISEVPLGAFLSGGVDSSAVVAMMAGVSAGSGQHLLDRVLAIRRSTSRHSRSRSPTATATRHFVDRVESDDFDLIDELARIYDEPYADSSAIPTYRVCQLARKHVTVALSGDGGDENFGGYRRYRLHVTEERLRSRDCRFPSGARSSACSAARIRRPTGRRACSAPSRRSRRWRAIRSTPISTASRSCATTCAAQLFSNAFKARLAGYTARRGLPPPRRQRAERDDPLALVQYLDLKTYLVGDINTKVDRASMAHSLEVREPLMDHPLVEWLATPAVVDSRCAAARASICSRRRWSRILPHEIMYRPKMGFAVPLARWFRGPLRQRVHDAILGPRLAATGHLQSDATCSTSSTPTSRARATTARRCGRC